MADVKTEDTKWNREIRVIELRKIEAINLVKQSGDPEKVNIQYNFIDNILYTHDLSNEL